MAATGKTPILLYGSSTSTNTPTAGNLTNSSDGCEIAINVADKNLFFKDATNTVNTVPIRQSSASSNGWLSSTDWTTFNNKGSGSVTSVSGTGTVNGLTLTGTVTNSGSLTLGGTLSGIANSALTNSSITFGSTAVSLGGTVSALNAVSLGQSTPAAGTFSAFTATNTTDLGAVVSTTGTNNAASVVIRNGNGTTAAQYSYIRFVNDRTSAQDWRFGTYGDANLSFVNSTAGTIPATLFSSGGVSIGNTTDPGAANLSVSGNVVIATSGKGIDFSATAGTGTSELLADYEEGTWTPTPTGLTTTGTPLYTGTYTKVGRQVFCTLVINANGGTTASTAGTTYFSGLPYAVSVPVAVPVADAFPRALTNGYLATSGNIFAPTWAVWSYGVYFSFTYTV